MVVFTPLLLELLGMGAGTPVVPPTPVPTPAISPSPMISGGSRWGGDKKWEQRYQPERDEKLRKLRDEEEELLAIILIDEWP